MKRINVTQTFLPPIEEYQALLQKLWESKILTNRGDFVLELEGKIQTYLQTTYPPLIVNNGTIALQIPIRALELSGEIITTPFSYVATTSSIVWENCTPVFVDINPDYLSIDETKIEAAITERTTAILAVHVYGNPCAVEEIEKLAKKHGLHVIYDAAHCFGVRYKGNSIFNYGDVSTCSFHATKLFHTGEGGAIFYNTRSLYTNLFNLHNFGHDGPEAFSGLGINAKISELSAAMGLAVLPYIDSIIAQRRELSEWYDLKLNWSKIRKPLLREGTEYNYAYYPVIFNSESELLDVRAILNHRKIYPRRYFYPSLNNLPYLDSTSMPISESIAKRVLCLPLFAGLAKEDVELISIIVNACAINNLE